MKDIDVPAILIPDEREQAWERYEKRFGKPYPLDLIYQKYGNDWEAEVKDIDRRIKNNDPA